MSNNPNVGKVFNISGGANVTKFEKALEGKQDKITGTEGQVAGFDAQGRAVAQTMPNVCTATIYNASGKDNTWSIVLMSDGFNEVPGSILFVGKFQFSIRAEMILTMSVIRGKPWDPNHTVSSAYPIYYKNSEDISDNIVSTNDSVTFLFDGTAFHIVAVTGAAQVGALTQTQADARYLQRGRNNLDGEEAFRIITQTGNAVEINPTYAILGHTDGVNTNAAAVVSANGLQLFGVVAPTNPDDGANKAYVDNAINTAITGAMNASY